MDKGVRKSPMLDPYKIREDFPIFSSESGKNLVYLDNAATTQRPRQVIEAIKWFYENKNANVHRGHYPLSEEADRLYEEAHERVAKFIGAQSWEEISFFQNTTHAISSIAIPIVEWGLSQGKRRILLTVMDHHSNMLPWRRAAELIGAVVDYVKVTEGGYLDMVDLERKMNDDLILVALPHASNVTGAINPVEKIASLTKKYDALLVVDGAQSIPHLDVDVKKMGIDFLAFSGHKMLGPFGIGALYARKDIAEELTPVITGGGTIKDVTLEKIEYANLPYRFEAGTPNVAGAVGLVAAIEYLENIGKKNIFEHEMKLLHELRKMLEEIDWIELYPKKTFGEHVGTVSFNVKGKNPHIVGKVLGDFYNIALRTGLHCAHPYHYAIGAGEGTVRASFYIYNTEEEVEYLVSSLREIKSKYLS
ncbi:MAG: aminotransferase class V-fold PLP-dependent enzyme [Fervidicoccaceae archaeon]